MMKIIQIFFSLYISNFCILTNKIAKKNKVEKVLWDTL